MSPLRPLLIIGTRPEAIKMAPIVLCCRKRGSLVEPIVCFTGQHREMLAQVADYFEITPDIDLQLMRRNQTLAGLTSKCIEAIDTTIQQTQPTCVVAQGDTTTVMAASVAAFYRQVPFVHVEAGLRTGDLQSPWPEEFNRRVAGLTASLHCAPTRQAADNLLAEQVPADQVAVTGNTVIDSLLWTVERERGREDFWRNKYAGLSDDRMVLITGHRRENFGQKFESICTAIRTLATRFPETQFVYPVHLNPRVRQPVHQLLGGLENIHLTEPAPYPEFVWLMDRAAIILTDSGGIQEEAPSLRKPVLVMRDTTERPEAIESGAVQLVGTSQWKIVHAANQLLTDQEEYQRRQISSNPYGDGHAAARILDLMLAQGWVEQTPISAPASLGKAA